MPQMPGREEIWRWVPEQKHRCQYQQAVQMRLYDDGGEERPSWSTQVLPAHPFHPAHGVQMKGLCLLSPVAACIEQTRLCDPLSI